MMENTGTIGTSSNLDLIKINANNINSERFNMLIDRLPSISNSTEQPKVTGFIDFTKNNNEKLTAYFSGTTDDEGTSLLVREAATRGQEILDDLRLIDSHKNLAHGSLDYQKLNESLEKLLSKLQERFNIQEDRKDNDPLKRVTKEVERSAKKVEKEVKRLFK
jgi:hypothetical protein